MTINDHGIFQSLSLNDGAEYIFQYHYGQQKILDAIGLATASPTASVRPADIWRMGATM